jgi:hypothetical protein
MNVDATVLLPQVLVLPQGFHAFGRNFDLQNRDRPGE